MKTIDMGLNTSPSFIKADELIAKFKRYNNEEMINYWEREKKRTEELRDSIISIVESEGVCELYWGCTGETRFHMHSCEWSNVLPQYDFEIGRYKCIVRKRVED